MTSQHMMILWLKLAHVFSHVLVGAAIGFMIGVKCANHKWRKR